MNTYPTTPCPDVGLEIQVIKPTTRVIYEAGYTSTRKKYTSGRLLFSLSYTNISVEDFKRLLTFFIENQGIPFKYIHNDAGKTTEYKVVFTVNELPEEIPSSRFRNTKLSFITS